MPYFLHALVVPVILRTQHTSLQQLSTPEELSQALNCEEKNILSGLGRLLVLSGQCEESNTISTLTGTYTHGTVVI